MLIEAQIGLFSPHLSTIRDSGEKIAPLSSSISASQFTDVFCALLALGRGGHPQGSYGYHQGHFGLIHQQRRCRHPSQYLHPLLVLIPVRLTIPLVNLSVQLE